MFSIRCELIAIGTTVPRVHSIISSIFSKFTRGSETSDSTNPLADGSKKKSKNKETKGKRMKEKNPSGIEMASLSSTHVDQAGTVLLP